MSEQEPEPEQDRQEQITAVVVKFVGITLAICLGIGLVTWIAVKALDLGSADPVSTGTGPVQPISTLPTTALPTTALPDPGETATATPGPSETADGGTDVPTNPTATPGSTDLFLNASPVFVDSEERINLTGQWPGHDAVSLLIQRREDGEWVDFGVQVQVEIGTFATSVQTSREGNNVFRVYDPDTDTASNSVTVKVGS